MQTVIIIPWAVVAIMGLAAAVFGALIVLLILRGISRRRRISTEDTEDIE